MHPTLLRLALAFAWASSGLPVVASVRVEEFEGVGTHDRWPAVLPEKPAQVWDDAAFAFFRLPCKYNDQGVRDDRDPPVLLRATATLTAPAGSQRLLLRSRGAARLFIDGAEVGRTPFLKPSSDGHDPVESLPEPPVPGARLCAFGDSEVMIAWESDGAPHEWVFETLVGGNKYRPEPGETCLAIERDGLFHVVAPAPARIELTDDGWESWVRERQAFFDELDTQNRRAAGESWRAGFRARHDANRSQTLVIDAKGVDDELERAAAAAKVPPDARLLLAEHCGRCHGAKAKGGLRLDRREVALRGGDSEKAAIVPGSPESSEVLRRLRDPGDERMPPEGPRLDAGQVAEIEKWIRDGALWEIPAATAEANAGVQPSKPRAELVDDHSFLRRVWLDTTGVGPDAATVRAFVADTNPLKREAMIDRLLDDPRWADHWTGYWQDVLAENPGMLKPSQNNTGPFRFWIHESFLDNKPMDQFVTELILMRGSELYGGPRGFGLAADNDVPAAEKAHVIGSAFLGVQMKCARCHDAPFHSVTQRDLFSVAAMFAGRSLGIPRTSRVPAAFFEGKSRQSLIKVSVRPEERIPPRWPFAENEVEGDSAPEARNVCGPPAASITRQRLADAVIADERFASVLVNRMWARYLGAGIVEPVDDWEGHPPSHPGLLDRMRREFVRSGYDWKHLARLILNTRAYQRRPEGGNDRRHPERRHFLAPEPRRLTAEQIVDSLFESVGRPISVEELTFDPDGRRPPEQMITLGFPRRAWMFCSLANERDRPALALPKAQAVCDVLGAFGWRSARPEPLTTREADANALQPGTLANGTMGAWLCRATDDSLITKLATDAPSAQALVETLFLQILGRPPREAESREFAALVEPGFASRIVPPDQQTHLPPPRKSRRVSWSNHLHPDATTVKLEAEKAARVGTPPTPRLRAEWRERCEDAVWALVNSPEFVHVP